MLGYVTCFFGAVEAQSRGSLHLHANVWCAGAPKLLQESLAVDGGDGNTVAALPPALADRMTAYLDSVVTADIVPAAQLVCPLGHSAEHLDLVEGSVVESLRRRHPSGFDPELIRCSACADAAHPIGAAAPTAPSGAATGLYGTRAVLAASVDAMAIAAGAVPCQHTRAALQLLARTGDFGYSPQGDANLRSVALLAQFHDPAHRVRTPAAAYLPHCFSRFPVSTVSLHTLASRTPVSSTAKADADSPRLRCRAQLQCCRFKELAANGASSSICVVPSQRSMSHPSASFSAALSEPTPTFGFTRTAPARSTSQVLYTTAVLP